MKNNFGLKVMAAVLAVAIVGSFAVTTKSNNLRAMVGDEGFVEEAPVEVVQEVVVMPEPEPIPEEPAEQPAEEAPVEEPTEQPAEQPAEEAPAEEPAEEAEAEAEEAEEAEAEEEAEEDVFDVEGAFATIRFMDEDSARAYLASLSGEDRAALKAYIAGLNIGDDEKAKLLSWFEPKQEIQPEPSEEPGEEAIEEIEVTPPDVNISFENLDGGKVKSGCHIRIHANVSNVADGMKLSYRWQYDAGNGWVDAEGGDGEYYDYIITKDNSNYAWHVIVGWTME